MIPIQTLYSSYYNPISSVRSDDAKGVINGITKTTTVNEFNALIQRNPNFKIEHYCGGCSLNSGKTALEMAALKGNYNLVEFIINNYGNNCLSIMNERGKTPILSIIKSKNPKSYMILELFINSGASVNFPRIEPFENSPFPFISTPLECACDAYDIKKIKLLLIHGAQFGVRFEKKGIKILKGETTVSENFNIQEVLFDNHDLLSKSQIYNQAVNEIFKEKIEYFPRHKFQFFLGTEDENSILRNIPIELVLIIFSKMQFPSRSLRKKAEEMLTAAIIPKKMTS